jgi:queuine tRNA-ribosyltransferase
LNAGEMLGMRLTTYHNLYYLAGLMKDIRQAIGQGRFDRYYRGMEPKLTKLYGGVT